MRREHLFERESLPGGAQLRMAEDGSAVAVEVFRRAVFTDVEDTRLYA